MYATFEEARKALLDAEDDVIGDFGEEAMTSAFPDIVESVALMCSDDVAAELIRTQLGWIPHWVSPNVKRLIKEAMSW